MTNPPAVWIDGDPLMEAIANAVYERCETGDGGIVHDDPRSIAAAAAHAVRALQAAEEPATTKAEDSTRTADPLAGSATEYRVPVPEGGGTNLIVRRQGVAFGAGWSVVVPGWGGGRAWTAEGWQDSISALSVARLFCWPDAETAVTEARRALAAGARQDGEQPS